MSARLDLRRTQTFFWTLITAPEGVRPGLETLVSQGEAGRGDLDDLIAGDAPLEPADRLDIYANMYFFRLLDCLKEDFPKLLEAAGADRFHNLITDYLLRHPSRQPSLRYLGERFPEFLAGHALGLECPPLADLARLEWARADLFDAADAPPLTRDDVARLPEDQAGDAGFATVPALTLLTLEHDGPGLWTAMKERAAEHAGQEEHAHPLPAFPKRRTAVRVWRKEFTVYHRAIDAEEADGLERLRAGESIGQIAQRMSAGQTPAKATLRFGRMFQGWIDDGLLAEVRMPTGR